MTKPKLVTFLAILFALAATTVSYELLRKHVTGAPGPGWLEAGCGASLTKGGTDCAAVLASPYSYLPPRRDDEPPGTQHLPVAFLGLVYYSVLSIWLIGIGRPSPSKRWLHLVPLGLVALGLAGSTYFLVIMFTKLDEWCLWCLVTHILNLLIAVCLWLMGPWAFGATVPAEAPPTSSPASASGMPHAHPSRRLILTTLLAVSLAFFGQVQMLGKTGLARQATAWKQGFDQCGAFINRLKSDTDMLVHHWQYSKRHSMAIRPDDPARGGRRGQAAPLTAVVYSDFECPSCQRLAVFLITKVEPLFEGDLRVVFKHFPLNSDCNPQTTVRTHLHACAAATIAEAAPRRFVGLSCG